MKPKTVLLTIATGLRYREYARNLIASATQYFVDHETIIFTDEPSEFGNYASIYPVLYGHQGFPQASFRRYHAFTKVALLISQYQYCFYTDVDMRWVARVTEDEICSDGITATEHPGYVGRVGTPENRQESRAYCPPAPVYFCGGFNGGTTKAFLKMSKAISEAIDEDDRKGIQAIWVDESHLQRYLYDNPPAKILSPSFCYPENDSYYKPIWEAAGRSFDAKLIALDKSK